MSTRSLWLFMAVFLQGCGHTPVTRTLADAFGESKGFVSILSSNFRYLKVTANGREALMVLGYSDVHPEGPIETWYSSEGEMLRLQNGRIFSTAGLELDWRSVRFNNLPGWASVIERQSVVFSRQRDEMPGHRFGLVDQVKIYSISPPKDAQLVGVDPRTVVWFEERVQSSDVKMPSARYALRMEAGAPKPIYGEQCLSTHFCMAWQTWPAKP
jgi:hypothetical protein